MSGHPVLGLLDESAARHPDRAVLRDAAAVTTAAELRDRVERRATEWSARGAERGDVLLVVGVRTAELPVCLLAAWRLGLVPALSEHGPDARLDALGRRTGARWRFDVDSGVLSETGHPSSPLPLGTSHVLFTSGTTGEPAAVAVGAEPLETAVAWYCDAFAPGPGDRFSMLSGLGHDPLLRDIIMPLASGAELAIPAADALRDPRSILTALREGVTVLHATPSLVEFALGSLEPGTRFPDLRLVVLGGERPRAETLRLLRAATDAVVVNAYGSTETPQIVAARVIEPGDGPLLGLVGRGIGGAELLLGRETPSDFRERVGCGDDEVVVRSRSLALGYLGDHDSRPRFVDDPLGEPGWRAYLTGDRGELVGGGIAVVGRIDRELAVNGHRLHPTEIESPARAIPGVFDAVARVEQGELGSIVVLSVALEPDAEVRSRDVRAALRRVLPAWAVPTRIEVAELALTANGKRAL